MVQVRQVISGTPPVTGISSLKNLTDVNDSAQANNGILIYNSSTEKHSYAQLGNDFSIGTGASGTVTLSPDTMSFQTLTLTDSATITNKLTVAGITYPTSNSGATSGMAIVTDGAGHLSFQYAGTASGIVVTKMQDLSDVITNLNSSRNDRDILIFDSASDKYGTLDFDAGVRANISVADSASGYGSLSYSSTTGIITHTKVSTANVRSAFSASGDLTYNESNGVFSFDVESVYTKDNFDSDLGVANTGQLPEGTNLYYTDARVDTYINASILTTDISEGTNLYYTSNRHDSDFDTRLATKTTDNVTEGSTNLFHTTARVNTAFDNRLATKTTANVTEGSNLYYTLARADSAIDVKITQAYVKATGLTFDDVTDNNAVTTNAVTVGSLNTTGGIVQHAISATSISSASTTLIDTVAGNGTFTSIEYLIQLNNDSATETQISKVTAAFDKSAVSISEYGVVHSGDSDLGTFTADVNSGNVRLFFQRRPSNTITVKTTKTIIQ